MTAPDPRAVILALLRRVSGDEDFAGDSEGGQGAEGGPENARNVGDTGNVKLTGEDKARFVRTIRRLLRVAFDPGVTPGERQAYMERALALAARYGIRFDDIGESADAYGSSQRQAPPSPGPFEDGELLPDPHHPLAVARFILPQWTDPDGNLTLRHWNGGWYRHDGSRWRESGDAEIRGWFYRRLERARYVSLKSLELIPWCPTKSKISSVLDALGTAIALVGSDLAPPAWLDDGDRPDPRGIVATANGLLDVSQGKLLPASAAFFNEVAVPFDYDPDAPPPGQWLKFVAELWPQDADSISLLQEWFGYIVSGRTDLHKICGIFGPPRSGKGTIARVLAELVGVKNTVGPTMAQLGTNFGMQEIPGKALAVISDARLGKSDPRMAVERLLAASGEDRITIDRKYREPWTGTLSARFIVLANEPPVFQDASGAIVTRFVILTTRNTFLGKEDRALTEKLKAELTGILNWSLEGLRRLDEGSGKFAQPESAAEVIQGMREVVSPVGAFLEERCQRGGSEAKETLYAAWLAWCKESRNHPGSIQQFSIDLRAAWPEVRDARPRNGGKRQRRWTGVSLRRE